MVVYKGVETTIKRLSVIDSGSSRGLTRAQLTPTNRSVKQKVLTEAWQKGVILKWCVLYNSEAITGLEWFRFVGGEKSSYKF